LAALTNCIAAFLRCQDLVIKLVDDRLNDESTSVRDAALSIIKKFLVTNPNDTQRYFHIIRNRVRVCESLSCRHVFVFYSSIHFLQQQHH
jgi:hypothetical protein